MQVIHVDRRINTKLEQLESLRAEATKASNVISGMPRSDSPNHQAMADTVVKIVDLEVMINRDIDQLIDLKAASRLAINALADPEHQLVLEMRYLCQKSWEDIAQAMGYGQSNIYRLHGIALKNLVIPES